MAKKVQSPGQQETAKALYDRMVTKRNPFVTRAEKCAQYTIPSLFPKASDNESTEYDTPYQSIGARGVNNLANKLTLALLPPNSPFFRLTPTDEVSEALDTQGGDLRNEVEEALARIERKIMRKIETEQIRVTVTEAVKQLIVAGNALLFLPPKEKGIKLYRLNAFVLQRDAVGNVITIIAKDRVAYAALPEEVQNLVATDSTQVQLDKEYDIYTHVYLEDGYFLSYQEVEGKRIPGTDQKYPKEKTPWIPVRMVKIDGQAYGRSFVEEYLGDLVSLENLQKAIIDLSAICATIIWLVNPSGMTNPTKLSQTKTGGFVRGRKVDVEALTLDKYADLQVAQGTASVLRESLMYVFLLNSAVQRPGERVTAEEIRYVARELEDTLGGVYSILSQEFQLPLVRRMLTQMQTNGEAPNDLPDEALEPSITTGLEALGRGQDLDKLQMFMQMIGTIPEGYTGIKLNGLYSKAATALNIDTAGLIKTDQEMMAEKNAAMMQEMLKGATPGLAKGFADANVQAGGIPLADQGG